MNDSTGFMGNYRTVVVAYAFAFVPFSTLKDFVMKAADRYDVADTKDEMVEMVIEAPAEKWDCETILSKL